MDWIANNIYWTDLVNMRIQVLDLDTMFTSNLLQAEPDSMPTAIAVDPSTRSA